MTRAQHLQQAYRHCATITRRHYENFPVASLLLPAQLRGPISVIYAFARTADDFADEGGVPDGQRLSMLDSFARQLDTLSGHGQAAPDPIFIALDDVVKRHRLSIGYFYDLLTAFRLDVTKKRYADIDELTDYCRHSAIPVGRLVLELCGQSNPRNIDESDQVCTALQLINFLQDIEQDYRENNRIYLPQDEMTRFGVSDADIAQRRNSPALKALIDFQIGRAGAWLRSGMPLGARLPGRIGLEIRCTISGGLHVLEALTKQTDVFSRPRLRKRDWLGITVRALVRRPGPGGGQAV